MPAVTKNKASVERRNERERRRIKNVNNAFDELREHVPPGPSGKRKISKVDTLQSAIEYIKVLEGLVKNRARQAAAADSKNKNATIVEESNNNNCIYESNKMITDKEMEINNNTSDRINNISDTICVSPQQIIIQDQMPICDANDSSFSDGSQGYFSAQNSPVDNGFNTSIYNAECGPNANTHGLLRELESPILERDIDNVLRGVTVEELEQIIPSSEPLFQPQPYYSYVENDFNSKAISTMSAPECVKPLQTLIPFSNHFNAFEN